MEGTTPSLTMIVFILIACVGVGLALAIWMERLMREWDDEEGER